MATQHPPTERRVLRKITPRGVPRAAKAALALLEESVDAEVLLGGSTAKGTHLADDHDIDIFLRYPLSTRDVSRRAARALKRVFPKLTTVHGSRDYFRAKRGAYTLELIPVLKVRSWRDARNVTDMSPLHTTHIRQSLARRPRLADDIRLAKQFLKAQRAYGAETHIGGFSGYALELLVLHYGGFRNLLAAAARWGERVVLDPSRHHEDALRALNESKLQSPLVLVDPVQPDRNAAAALTRESFERLREAARAYLRRPGESFFKVVPLTKASVERKYPGARVIAVRLRPKPGKDDVQGAKCHAVFTHLQEGLRAHEFPLIGAQWEFRRGEAILFFALERGRLPRERIAPGPPTSARHHAEQFKAKHARTFTKGGRLYAREERAFTSARLLLANLCGKEYVRSRVRSASVEGGA